MPPGPHKRLKLLADVCVPGPLIAELRAYGLKIKTVVEVGVAGHPDENVYALTTKLKRVLFTMDRDFWDDKKHRLQKCPGVIVLDIPPDRLNDAIEGFALFYVLFAKEYPLDWWHRIKAKVTKEGFVIKVWTWEGRVFEQGFRLDKNGKLLTRIVRE